MMIEVRTDSLQGNLNESYRNANVPNVSKAFISFLRLSVS